MNLRSNMHTVSNVLLKNYQNQCNDKHACRKMKK